MTKGRGLKTIILFALIVILCTNGIGAIRNSFCTLLSCKDSRDESTDSWGLSKQLSSSLDLYNPSEDTLRRSTRMITAGEGRKEVSLVRNLSVWFTLSIISHITLHKGSEAYLRNAVMIQAECSARSLYAVIQFIQNKDGSKD